MVPKKEQILKTEIEETDAGTITRITNTKTGEVVKEEFRSADATVPPSVVRPGEDPPVSVGERPPLNAQEMLRRAIIEREESYGRLVRGLVNTILNQCLEVILLGKLTYDVEKETPAEIVKGAVAELKGLGYGVQKSANPKAGGGVSIAVKWQTEVKQGKVKKPDNTGPITVKAKEKTVFTALPEVEGDTESITFKPTKEKPFSRPKKKIPAAKKEEG